VLDWLTYLADEAGHEGARAVLGRYRELGWFTGTVEESLRGYMLGVGRPEGEGTAALDRTDHLVSFVYVVKLSTLARDRRPPARDGDERRDRHGDGDRSPQDRP
jgi:archaellum component FlaD/FlaE